MHTEILRTDKDNPDPEYVREGARILKAGGLVVFPTETVYGLGADSLNGEACRRIFEVKRRPADNPLILHISDMSMLQEITESVDKETVEKLASVWPAPLTVLFSKSSKVPDQVTGKSPYVAVRMPDNRLALDLIGELGKPIAAPSANLSTRPSITDSRHAVMELDGKVDLIYDCGPLKYGIESTIILLSKHGAEVVRAGSFPVEDLREIFGDIVVSDVARGLRSADTPVAPGMKYRHYAPSKPLLLCSNIGLFRQISSDPSLKNRVLAIGINNMLDGCSINTISLGNTYPEASARLFSSFRQFEMSPEKLAVIHGFSESGIGLAIMSRIRKASAAQIDSIEELSRFLS